MYISRPYKFLKLVILSCEEVKFVQNLSRRTIYRRLQLNKRNGTCSHVKSVRNCVSVPTDDFLNRQASNNENQIELSSSYFNNLPSPENSTELSQNVSNGMV